MKYIDASKSRTLYIGYQGEDNRTVVKFPTSCLTDEPEDGTFTLFVKRNGDTLACPVPTTFEDGEVLWAVREVDTAKIGHGEAQLVFTGSNSTPKTKIWDTVVFRSITSDGSEDDPADDYVAKVLKAAKDIEDLTVSAHSLPEGSAPTATKTKPEGQPYNIDFGIPAGSGTEVKPFISLERQRSYLYKVSYNTLPPDNDTDTFVPAGCSSYVKDGKLYRNLDWSYSETPEFIVQCKGFKGLAFSDAMTDTSLNPALIGQLPYHIVDGRNDYGIMVSTHVLYNDWDAYGTGDIPLTKLPYLVLTKVKSMATLEDDLDGVLDNLIVPQSMRAAGYLIQVLVTDGTTTYVLRPGNRELSLYEAVNITVNPKLTNFRWVEDAIVERTQLQERPTGVERWNMIPASLEDLRFTKAYEAPDRLSEFIGIDDTTKDSTDEELEAIYDRAHAEYLVRQRNGVLWQTMHSVVYSAKGMEHLWVQEDYTVDYGDVSGGGDGMPDPSQYEDGTALIKVGNEWKATEGYGYVSTEEAEILEETSVRFVSGLAITSAAANIIIGKTYTFSIDGTDYEGVAYTEESYEDSVVFIGNLHYYDPSAESTGEPFLIYQNNGSTAIFTDANDDNLHLISISGEVETTHKIDPKFIPDGAGLPDPSMYEDGAALIKFGDTWKAVEGYGYTKTFERGVSTPETAEIEPVEGLFFIASHPIYKIADIDELPDDIAEGETVLCDIILKINGEITGETGLIEIELSDVGNGILSYAQLDEHEQADYLFLYVPEDGQEFTFTFVGTSFTLTFPTAGLYAKPFNYDYRDADDKVSIYASEIVIRDKTFRFDGTDELVQKIDAKYLPEIPSGEPVAAQGEWDIDKDYPKGSVVWRTFTYGGATTRASYLAADDIPAGTQISDEAWQMLAKDGDGGKIISASASIDSTYGTPTVSVYLGGTEHERRIGFEFSHLRGKPGISIYTSASSITSSTQTISESAVVVPTGSAIQEGDLILSTTNWGLARVASISGTTVSLTYIGGVQGSLPATTSADAGKIPMVQSNGTWGVVTVSTWNGGNF